MDAKYEELINQYTQFTASINNSPKHGDQLQLAIASTSIIKTTNSTTSLKLNFSKFDGEDPNGWIYWAKQYFEYQNIVGEQKVQLAVFHLEGGALEWYRWLIKTRGQVTWAEFCQALLKRFGPIEFDDALSQLKQTVVCKNNERKCTCQKQVIQW